MVQNIAIIGMNRDVAYEVSKLVASQLDMHFMDTIDLFEFDNHPRTLSDMLKQFGLRYFREKEKGTIKYVAGFTNSVINIESGMSVFKNNFKMLKTTSLVIYLKQDIKELEYILAGKKYPDRYVKDFYCLTETNLLNRDDQLSKNADIVVKIYNESVFKIASEVIRQIKLFYGVK